MDEKTILKNMLLQKRKKKVAIENIEVPKKQGMACRKCDSHQVRYVIIQSRSADEGCSANFVCEHCKFQWHER